MYYGLVEYVGEGPDCYRPKMFQVPVGYAIRASAGGWFCEIYCGLSHAGGDWRRGSLFGRCLRCVALSNLSVGWCGILEIFAKCLLRRFDCSMGEGIVLLFVVMASCVSGVSVYLLLRLLMSLQSFEGVVMYVIVLIVLRSCFHLVCCSSWISLDISLFSVCVLLMISGVGN